MNLQLRLMDDLKNAMRSGDEIRRSVIRLIRAGIKNEEINKGRELDDIGVVEILTRMSRQYRESIEVFRQNHREDLALKEEAELAIVIEYMPEQLPIEEVRRLVEEIAKEQGARSQSDKGRLMGKIMPQIRGKADGNLVNKVVDELLESLGS